MADSKGGLKASQRFVIIAVLAWMLIISGCQNQGDNPASEEAEQKLPDQESWNSTIIFTVEGKRSAIVRAGHIEKYLQSGITEADQKVEVQFFDEAGNPSSTLTAEKGIVDEKTQDLEAMGNVVVVSQKGVKLETERLRWDNGRRKILSNGFVKLSTEKKVVTGTGFESDQALEHWRIKKNIRARVERSSKGREK